LVDVLYHNALQTAPIGGGNKIQIADFLALLSIASTANKRKTYSADCALAGAGLWYGYCVGCAGESRFPARESLKVCWGRF